MATQRTGNATRLSRFGIVNAYLVAEDDGLTLVGKTEKSSRKEEYVFAMSPDHTQARDIAVALAERAGELARLLGDLPERPGASAVDRVRNAEREVGEQLERLAAQMEEFLPAEPMERLFERDGTRPASAEQFAAFVAEHSIPSEEG